MDRGSAVNSDRLIWVYTALLALGVLVPASRIVPWLRDHGLDIDRFFDELFANPVSSFFAWDVIMAVVTLLVLACVDRGFSTRQRVVIGAASLLGASVGLPAYLLVRERNRRRQGSPERSMSAAG
jgi:hypothetical protein